MAPTPAEDPLAFLSRGLLESLDGGGSSGAAHHSQQQVGSSSSAGAFHPPPSSSNGALSGESVSSSMLMSHHGRQPAPSALHLQHRPFVPSPQQGGSGGFGEPLDQRGLPHPQQMYEGSRSIDFDRGQSMLDDGGGGYGRHLQPGQGYAYSQQQQQQSHSASRSPYPPMSQFETHSPTTSVHLGPYGEPDGYPPPPSGAGGLYYPQSQHSLPPDPLYGNHHQQQQQQPPLRQASMPLSSASQGGFGPSGFQLLSPPGAPPMHFGQPPKVSQPQQQLQQQQKPLRQASMPAQGSSLALSMLPVGLGGVNPLLGQNGRFPRTGGGGPGVGGNSSPGGRAELEEEISTIFVVGFPDDMQEREFQNMFTFCAGFEAATLKLPPAQSAAIPAGTQQQPGMQNSAVAATAAAVAQAALGALAVGQAKSAESSLLLQHSGQQPFLDPAAYDPGDPAGGAPSSALGLGGFLLAPPSTAVNGAAGGPSTAIATASGPPRRQSIGFAKFKTRQAALDARDALQGRKVDVERASVLKAEMAKKNLHTRRGVGGDEAGSPSAPVSGGTGGGGINVVGGGVAVGLGPQSQPYGAAGRSGDLSSNTSPWFNSDRPQATVEDESGRESPPVLSASSLSSTPPSHLQSPTLGLPSDTPFLHPPPLHSVGGEGSSAGSSTGGHFSGFRNGVGNGGKDGNFPLSPESFGLARSFTQSQPMDLRRSDELAAFSPPLTPGGTGVGSQALASAHLRSPSLGPQSQQQQSQAGSSSQLRPPPDDGARDSDPSSTSGSASSSFGKATGGKNLPRTANPADMNPPINTLYVGNLPTSSAPSSSNTQLEDALRALFSRCDGFRRLSYRQKTNGPMCFVEFEDVEAASMTLKALYGDTIHGLVKGGIRLSFSKHPLGQRGPASTPTASVHNGGVGGSSWTSSSSSVGSPPLAGQTISSPVIDYSFSIDHSDSSTSAGSHRHHARPPVPFGAGFGQNASTSAGQQQQRTTGSGGLPMPSRPASQNRSQSRHSSPAGALSYPPADAFPSSKAAGQMPSFPASLGRSPPQSRRGLTSSTPATNGAWNSPSFSPFGHDLDNGQ